MAHDPSRQYWQVGLHACRTGGCSFTDIDRNTGNVEMSADALSGAPLSRIRQVFAGLEPAPAQVRFGFFRASFIGPWWLRSSAGPSLALSGLAGWQGKRFLDEGTATNVLKAKGGLVEKLRMQCQPHVSAIDGRSGVALRYGATAVPPWRWVVDELRVLDDDTLLCMTTVDLPLLRRLSFPFLLRRAS
jgi:hypothetical protein